MDSFDKFYLIKNNSQNLYRYQTNTEHKALIVYTEESFMNEFAKDNTIEADIFHKNQLAQLVSMASQSQLQFIDITTSDNNFIPLPIQI